MQCTQCDCFACCYYHCYNVYMGVWDVQNSEFDSVLHLSESFIAITMLLSVCCARSLPFDPADLCCQKHNVCHNVVLSCTCAEQTGWELCQDALL